MKILVSIPIEIYNGLLGRCSLLSREYLILKNGIIRRDDDKRSEHLTVEILCEAQRAKFLLDFATLVFPAAAPHIEKSINLAQEQ
ncbi:MAG TPA: hypothetical protein VFX54_13965 [Candidatus Binatia bacterium]|nr:hypothetical protein [Candidatus Binatia bacterium]